MKPTLPIYVLQSLQGHLSVVQDFIFSLNISNEFALLMSLGTNSHIFGASEDMLSVPISAYLFILVMEVLFTLIKNNEKIQGLDILNYRFLYSAYADDSTFFLRNIDSVLELARTFKEHFRTF